MTRTLRKGGIQQKPHKIVELEVKAENMSMNQGTEKTEFVCFGCGAVITVKNSVLESLEGTIQCPICALQAEESSNKDTSDEISVEELANQVKKLTELSQQQIEIQRSILVNLGL